MTESQISGSTIVHSHQAELCAYQGLRANPEQFTDDRDRAVQWRPSQRAHIALTLACCAVADRADSLFPHLVRIPWHDCNRALPATGALDAGNTSARADALLWNIHARAIPTDPPSPAILYRLSDTTMRYERRMLLFVKWLARRVQSGRLRGSYNNRSPVESCRFQR